MGETLEKKTFRGIDKKVVVKPVMRVRNSLISDPEHEAFFLVGNATITYCLPMDRYGNLNSPFTDQEGEREWLEKELDLDLNYHKRTDNFWKDHKVRLGKDNKVLDLKNPKDYVDYLVLLSNTMHIAPNGEAMHNRATYRYALVSEEFETRKAVSEGDLMIEAYTELGVLKGNKQAMIDFLKVYGRRVADVSKEDFLFKEIKKIVEKDREGFLHIIKDKENYETKLLIAKGVEVGAIIKDGRKYTLPGGDPLCSVGDVATLDNAVKYLNSPAHQDVYTTIVARVENAKD